jgi:hypothetical protein
MTPTPKSKATASGNEATDSSLSTVDRLARIETRLDFLVDSVASLSEQIRDSDEAREANWLEYLKNHADVTSTVKSNTQKISALESSSTNLASSIEGLKELHCSDIDRLDDELAPIKTMHKVLIWVSIFFATSIGGLIWALLTHTVELIHR